jgi:hypothetical protein
MICIQSTVKTLGLALQKAAALPEPVQEQLGREILDRIEALTELHAQLEIGLRELDAGLGREIDVEDLIRGLHAEHGARDPSA